MLTLVFNFETNIVLIAKGDIYKLRKYQTEFGLNAYTQFKTIIPAAQLEDIEKSTNYNYHIYGILLGPKYFIKPDSICQCGENITLVIFANAEDDYVEYQLKFTIAPDFDHNQVKISSKYPHSILKLDFEDEDWAKKTFGKKDIEIQVSELFNLYALNLVSRVKYRVLYIGQAYGKRGERCAVERLSQHSTFQKILIDCQRNYPECEIYIMLLDMAYKLGVGIAKPSIVTEKTSEDDVRHITEVFSDLPKEQQMVNITEAALINYFKPIYNSNFVENFPCPNHKSYRQYYDLDYNEITVELDMEFDNFPFVELYTDEARIPSAWKFIHYQLENGDRESMYSMFKNRDS